MPLIRSANFNLLVEIVVRIALISTFCYMESMTPFVRVIHQSDLELEYKYPRRESYVPGGALWSIVLSVPCILTLLAWVVCNDCNDALEILLAWSLALGINGIATDTFKIIAGRPRPDFFYRCFPDGVETDNLECNGDIADIMDGRKSFLSGHSSLSFCSLGVLSLWLCGRLGVLSWRRGSGARVVITLVPLFLATCIALSRTCDYHHHWEDVLAGSTLGFTVALFCYRQYYHPLSSANAGLPYSVTNKIESRDSPGKEKDETSPLLNGRKEDKWI